MRDRNIAAHAFLLPKWPMCSVAHRAYCVRSAGRLSLATPVESLRLPGRGRKALRRPRVLTLQDFFCLDLRLVGTLRSCGAVTVAALGALRDDLWSQWLSQIKHANGEARRLPSDLEQLPLGTDERQILRRLGIHTVPEFLGNDFQRLPWGFECPVTERQRFVQIQNDLRQELPADSQEDVSEPEPDAEPIACPQTPVSTCPEIVASPASFDSWRALSFFSDRPLPLLPSELHSSYAPHVPVACLRLPAAASRAITKAGIQHVGELLLVPGAQLRRRCGFSRKRLVQVQSLVAEFPAVPLRLSLRLQTDYSSPDAFLASLISPVVQDERERGVFLGRMGWRSAPITLEALARRYGFTREWVRQLEKKAIKRLVDWRARAATAPLHEHIVRLLREHSPLVAIQTVGVSLQRQHGWKTSIHPRAVEKLLPLFPDIRLVQERFLCLKDFRCARCGQLPKILRSVPESGITLRWSAWKRSVDPVCGECPSSRWMEQVDDWLPRIAPGEGMSVAIPDA